MLEGAATYALFIKMVPYVIGIRLVSGAIDIGVHAVKCRMGREKKWR